MNLNIYRVSKVRLKLYDQIRSLTILKQLSTVLKQLPKIGQPIFET